MYGGRDSVCLGIPHTLSESFLVMANVRDNRRAKCFLRAYSATWKACLVWNGWQVEHFRESEVRSARLRSDILPWCFGTSMLLHMCLTLVWTSFDTGQIECPRVPLQFLNARAACGQRRTRRSADFVAVTLRRCRGGDSVDFPAQKSALLVRLLPFAPAPCCLWLHPCHHVLRYTQLCQYVLDL